MEFFDSHSHLNDEKFDNDREEIVQMLKKEKITRFLTCGYDLAGSKKAIELAEKIDFTYATVGISPNDIPQNEEELWKMLDEIKNLIKNNNKKVVAVGEIGLDYYWNTDNKELQTKAFIEQIKLANELDLPIVIHTRDAVYDTLEIIKNNPVNKKGVFHCCPLNIELVKEAVKLGYYISLSGIITFKNAKPDEIIKFVPEDKLLIETDSPYLSPEPNRGKRNDSSNLIYIINKIAEVKNEEPEKIAKKTCENAKKFFNI